MRTGRKPGERMRSRVSHAGAVVCAYALLLPGLAGCGHKQIRAAIPVALPVDLEVMNAPEDQIDPVPEPDMVPLPWPEPPRPPVRRRPPPRDDAANPAQPGSETPAAPELSIGLLSPGGSATPQSQQQARELIASTERRITGLPERVASSQRSQVRQARDFLDKSKKALDSGDADGAMNLANKAKLLMDELEQR